MRLCCEPLNLDLKTILQHLHSSWLALVEVLTNLIWPDIQVTVGKIEISDGY